MKSPPDPRINVAFRMDADLSSALTIAARTSGVSRERKLDEILRRELAPQLRILAESKETSPSE